MHFGSFHHVLILYKNNTMVYSRKLKNSLLKMVHNINIETGETEIKCVEIKTGKLSKDNCKLKSKSYDFATVDTVDDEYYRKNYIFKNI